VRVALSSDRRIPRRWTLAGLAVAGAIVIVASFAVAPWLPQVLRPSICPVPPNHDPEVIVSVYEVGVSRGVSDTLMRAAFAAGWVESHMHNLPCGDRDSLGVFQQRPSQDWGRPEQILDIEYATHQFFDRAERVAATEPNLTPGELAQRVQRSAFPERYARADTKARLLQAEAARLAAEREK